MGRGRGGSPMRGRHSKPGIFGTIGGDAPAERSEILPKPPFAAFEPKDAKNIGGSMMRTAGLPRRRATKAGTFCTPSYVIGYISRAPVRSLTCTLGSGSGANLPHETSHRSEMSDSTDEDSPDGPEVAREGARRHREAGSSPEGDDQPDMSGTDGREAARALYGGLPEDHRPRCSNCGKAKANHDDIGCTKCDPRAGRAGMPGHVPISPNKDE